MQSFIILGVVTLQWVLFGYSLAFGPDIGGGLLGGLDFVFLNNVGMEPSGTIPHVLFMIFQGMFAVITPALITGAFAERFKFSTFLIFTVIWCTVVYDPICHWVWGPDGWIGGMGALDFAGGTVVHISSGVAALAAALVVGPRRKYLKEPMFPHNLTMTLLGAALLWFGWFGFNAGSALAADGIAAMAFVTTHVATAAAAAAWTIVEWWHRKKPTVLGAASGAVAGLVAVTPGAGFVTPMSAIFIGIGGGVLCYIAVTLKPKLGYDDSLDVVGVHGVGGTWGAIATGLFATVAVNPGGANGLFYGNPGLVVTQLIAVGATMAYSFIVSIILLKALDMIMGLRVSNDEELIGLDNSLHGESGYIFD
jgi:Amt family ammonium transporter